MQAGRRDPAVRCGERGKKTKPSKTSRPWAVVVSLNAYGAKEETSVVGVRAAVAAEAGDWWAIFHGG